MLSLALRVGYIGKQMQLPNADEAIVPRDKLENYLLDLAHPIGGGKARFLLAFRFQLSFQW
jgi:hypothetical protein